MPVAYLRRIRETKAFPSSMARVLILAISLAPTSCLGRDRVGVDRSEDVTLSLPVCGREAGALRTGNFSAADGALMRRLAGSYRSSSG